MAQLLVRNLEESVTRRLKQRARRHGRSTEDEVRHILRNSVAGEGVPVGGLGSRIAARFSKLDPGEAITELRGHAARRADL